VELLIWYHISTLTPLLMHDTVRYLLPGLLLSLSVLPGCSSSSRSDMADAPQTEPVPTDFKLTLGQGGGFAGRWTGFTIDHDGTISEWSGPVAESNMHPAGTLSSQQLQAIWRDATESEFFSQEIAESGELTAFLKINADSIEHRVFWIPGVEELESPKHPAEAMYRRTLKVASAAKTASDNPVNN
jgi:hypothetical protein